MVNLTRAEVGQEEGIVMNENSEPMWCFTITEMNGQPYYFATFIPEERDSWFQVLYDITSTHNKLVCHYLFQQMQKFLFTFGNRMQYMRN